MVNQKKAAWHTVIGLQDVEELKVSHDILDTESKH